ncbi:MAG: tRNA uridine-5-carboxymethylaminomethyl(34) synthesis GTPase MnmE, partial [Bacteroidales bacterium]
MYLEDDTICAIATPLGVGGIAVIRVSGENALKVVNPWIQLKKKEMQLGEAATHRLFFANFVAEGELLDEVVVAVFRNPHSYTGEDVVEISCHGSVYVQRRILEALIGAGARLAKGGEFTMRAFLNGKMDLSQAEAVMDLIGAENKASHHIAMKQLKGGFSSDIALLRQKLLDFASLIELELDFSEEDVEFADRKQLLALLTEIKETIGKLRTSFALGNVLKNGIAVAIVGRPNVGKSTLLNALLNEEKAIVSEIAGTTRDMIEDVVNLDGVLFRFIDTAGLRNTEDTIEKMGIERTRKRMEEAQVVLYLF